MFKKNNSFGFTIVELLAIIVVLGVVIGIAVPAVNTIINRSKTESYNDQVAYIERAAKNFVDDNDVSLETSEEYVVQMTNLCNNGYLKCPINNPLNGEVLNGYVLVTFTSNAYNYYFVDLTTGATTGSYPVILLNGYNYVTLGLGDTFTDLVSAYDAEDGDITNIDIVYKDGEGAVIDEINTLIPDEYTIEYTVTDLDGNVTVKERSVVVLGTYLDPNVSFVVSPIPSDYNSSVAVTITNDDNFTKYYKWTNSLEVPTDGWVSFSESSTIFYTADLGVITGTWYLHIKTVDPTDTAHYSVSSGIIVDGTPPVIVVTGSETISIDLGGEYIDAGAIATDDTDSTVNVVVSGDTVDTCTAGTYNIYYDATDSRGNEAIQVSRAVTVSDGYYLQFDGIDDYVDIADLSSTIDFASGFTIEMDAKWDVYDSWGKIFDLSNGPSDDEITLTAYYYSGDGRIMFCDASACYGYTSTSLLDLNINKWTLHMSSGGAYTLYKGETLMISQTSSAVPVNTTRTVNYLAKSSNEAHPNFEGKIYEFKIIEEDGDVVLWYKFNEGSGTTLTDYSGNGYDGTINGATWGSYTTCY